MSRSGVLDALPPSPGLSVTHQMLRWLTRPFDFLRECAQTLGDAFSLDFGSYGTYALFSHADAIRTLFLADAATLHAGKGNSVLRAFLGPHSLLLLDGPRHLEERRVLLPAFHGARIAEYGAVIRTAAEETARSWAEDQTVVILEAMQGITLDAILRIVFGPGESPELDDLKRDLQALLNDPRLTLGLLDQIHDDLRSSDAWRTIRTGFARVERLVLSQIARTRDEGGTDRGDMLSLLVGARREDGRPVDDGELRDEVITLLVTGYETTATALAWAFHWLHQTPAVLHRLREHLAALGPDPGPAALARLEYLDATCKETLRISPVIPLVAREVQRPFQIQGYLIPPGMTVAACIYLAHQRSDLYPAPDDFRPERFLDRDYSPYEFLPFGGGVRRCIGMPLALYEMKIVLGTLLRRYAFEPIPGETVRPVRRSVTVAPSGGTRLTVSRVLGAGGGDPRMPPGDAM
jgi:cytochrome P450 family 110